MSYDFSKNVANSINLDHFEKNSRGNIFKEFGRVSGQFLAGQLAGLVVKIEKNLVCSLPRFRPDSDVASFISSSIDRLKV